MDEMWFPFHGQIALRIYYLIFLWWKMRNLDFKSTVKKLNTPIKVQAWLFWNIKYTKDTPIKDRDEWQKPEITFERKRGDCEDWALFAMECLRKRDCYILCMYTKDTGHATCIIKTMDWLDTGDYVSVGTFGIMNHYDARDISSMIPDWRGYKNWTRWVLRDSERNLIKKKQRK